MATDKPDCMDVADAGADLSAQLYRLAKLDSSGNAVLAGAGEQAYGSIYEAAASGNPATIATGGLVKVVLGATVAPMAKVTADANAAAVTATTGNEVFGICRSGGAAGEIGIIKVNHAGIL